MFYCIIYSGIYFSRYKTFTELKGFAEERESIGLPSLFCPLKIKLLDGVVVRHLISGYFSERACSGDSGCDINFF